MTRLCGLKTLYLQRGLVRSRIDMNNQTLFGFYVVVNRMGDPSFWSFDEIVTKKYGCQEMAYDPTSVCICGLL